jgi:peptidoglycan/LPS O-acetylase OafA/YrhL
MEQRTFLVSIGVCYFVGVPMGTVVYALLTGSPWLVFDTDIAGVPLLVYAFVSGVPVAVVAGMLGGAVLIRLLRSKDWNPNWPGWILTCAAVGAIAAIGLASALAGLGLVDKGPLIPAVTFLGVTGGSCGALLGLYGWTVKRKSDGQCAPSGSVGTPR